MIRTLLPFVLLLAACSPAVEDQSAGGAGDETAAAEEQAPAATPSLEGDWAVQSISGAAEGEAKAMQASFTGDRLTVRSDCLNMHWGYNQDRNIVSFEEQDSSGCPGRKLPAETQLAKAVNLANIAMFEEEGRKVTLSGAGGAVTMMRR